MMPDAAGATKSGLRSCEVVGGDLVLVLNNTIAAVEDARLQIEQRLEPLELSPRVTNRIEVILEELVSNVVRHGFRPGSDQSIRLVVVTGPETIDLTLEDDGVAFDPTEAAQPGPLQSLETAKLGGLGLPLVRKFAARLAYEGAELAPCELAGGRLFQPRNRLTVALARSV